ncbi:MAG TPA: uroporphyrinogen decarboxylase [Thermoplasmata archaeon]|nr:uroporphyrinogen decarboxylase [Thermoplasmata archaeon]
MTLRTRFVDALQGGVPDTVPVWLMRQAGRYLPGYRRLRTEHSILEIARTPALAAEVTLEPVRRFDVDAGVVFADITLPYAPMGVDFRIDPGVGPVVTEPIRDRPAVDRLRPIDAEADLGFVGEAIDRFRDAVPDRPIVGFGGAPFTLAAYLIEGGASREFAQTKKFLARDPAGFRRLVDRLATATTDYLRMQARHGAAALQLFDTWAGVLGRADFAAVVAPSLEGILSELAATGRPTIYFSTSSAHLLPQLKRLGATALGVDWRLPLSAVRREVGAAIPLQGNLDPGALLGDADHVRRRAGDVLRELPDHRGHVFNLGHGVLPETDPERVRDLVEFVHAAGAR